ncbi:MAG: hypothetical protein JWQ97_1823 [Phenylobacterium sp.]|nr:hypothetical protein [Phenylobacterium sp.]
MSGCPVAVMLRAVNLAGRRLAMADFKAALADLGFPGARTLGASGNAVISAPEADAALEARLEQGLGKALAAPVELVVRDGAQLQAVLETNPFPQMAKDAPNHLLVMFLKGEPAAQAVAALRAKITGPEEVEAGPACLYARFPDDLGHSKLTSAVIERALKLRGTGRNWNTVSKLAGMTGGG